MKTISASSDHYLDDADFESLFRLHYKALLAYATVIVKDEDDAEEIVQQLFLKFWERRAQLSVQTSLKAYLYKCVYHDSLNYLKHQKVKTKYQDFTHHGMDSAYHTAADRLELTELQQQINLALNDLPEQCRTIFQMSRFEELKYREIAEELGLSTKTIENQMGKALRIMRIKLADFLILLLSCLMYYKDFLK
ncbi:RNA polymerase sigma-70 factor [Pedobacter insulae]|uniref:RNA polymerase sigma-70 factor, ECF subfamily n=1 Tax=Pedobacter insulae TaxID=414048 RepID=A0A1I2WII8_9SPHI|nr:RNA polymerase sigma-70 factor [Pedobacter insulae]SFH01180.1 RNA polymerase sigma-70 factor, ECF subfamily [Pedobacter insulae]